MDGDTPAAFRQISQQAAHLTYIFKADQKRVVHFVKPIQQSFLEFIIP